MFNTIIRLDIFFETLSFFISLAIALIAFAGGRKTGSRSLTLLSIGFLLMALAMLLRILLTSFAFSLPMGRPFMLRGLFFFVLQAQEVVYSAMRVAAYAVFLYLYASYSIRDLQSMPILIAVAPSLIYNPFLEAVSVTILTIVLAHLAMIRKHIQNPYSFYGFVFLTLSHVLFLALPLNILLYFAAQFFQLMALLLFLTAVLSVFGDGKGL
ncbi:MAG: hypothetical protein QXF45_00190 [Candidatus Caldarchaeum sp.]